ncbi:MAG: PaaI family thioesterase [Alphaproteobacteria bacterium]
MTSKNASNMEVVTGDIAGLFDAIPFAHWLGLMAGKDSDGVLCRMPFAQRLIGNPNLPALHGGIVATFLEATALAVVVDAQNNPDARCGKEIPRVISTTVDYLRPAGPKDTFARAEIIRLGTRLATVVATAWQDDLSRPVARANCHFLVASGGKAS